jgi:hypothetical protein
MSFTVKGLFMFCLVYALASSAQETSDAQWAVYHQGETGTFWFQVTADGLGVYLSQVKVSSSLENLIKAIDPMNQKFWRTAIQAGEILQVYPEQQKLFRMILELTWPIQPRDIVAFMRVTKAKDSPAVTVTFDDRSHIEQEQQATIRISDFQAQWQLIPCPDKQVVLVHMMRMNPEGALPRRMFHWLMRRNQPENFTQLQAWLSEQQPTGALDGSFKNWSPLCTTWLQDPIGGL